MGYALRRDDHDDQAPEPTPSLRERVDRWLNRIRGALRMSYLGGGRVREAFGDVAQMGRLAENWDGHGGGAVSKDTMRQAAHFLQRVDEKFGGLVPRPTVGAMGNSLVLVWRINPKPGERVRSEREIEMIFHDRGNEWSVSYRTSDEPTMSGEDVDGDALLKIVDRFIVA